MGVYCKGGCTAQIVQAIGGFNEINDMYLGLSGCCFLDGGVGRTKRNDEDEDWGL